ncbi:MAG: universal stress protein [Acidobacteriia bacterium]|nr:universal stress protein [Terriglobia bacterium]
MSDPDTSHAIRRILVALDASPDSVAALEMAVDLAARMEAELAGLFVEDVALLRMADSPSAREIAYPAASQAPLNRAIMERKLRAQSEQIRNTLAAAAHRAQLRWSFQTVRGEVTSVLRTAAGQSDIVAIGRLGWSSGSRLRIGSTALELATSRIPLLLISRRAVLGNLRLAVYYDGSPASKSALLVTASLARPGAQGITVLVCTADYEKTLAEIRSLLQGRAIEVRYRRVDPDQKTSLLRAVKDEGAVLLVLADRQLLKDVESFEALLREVEVPLLLLGNGFGHEEADSSRQIVG